MGMPQDLTLAANCLRRIGYYRLSGYWYPLRQRNGEVVLDVFREGASFKHAFDLYVFDKRLRMMMLDAIERIEVGLRVDIALLLGKSDPWAHRDVSHFGAFFRRQDQNTGKVKHVDWLNRVDELCLNSREEFAKHFRTKYGDSHFPIWIAIELWDFGALSHLINGLHDRAMHGFAV